MATLDLTPAIIDPVGTLPKQLPDTYDSIIQTYGNKYKIDPKVIKKVIAIESGYNPNEVSRVQALGLMQVMPFQLKRLNISRTAIFKPEVNVNAGTRILREMHNQVSNWKVSRSPATNFYLSLAAYNGGPTRLKRLINKYGLKNALKYMPLETQNYVLKYKHLDKFLEGGKLAELQKQPVILAGFDTPALTLPKLKWRGIPADIKTSKPEWDKEDIQAIVNMPVLMVEEKAGLNTNYLIWAGIGLAGLLFIINKKKKEMI